jgi:hypothetical protein
MRRILTFALLASVVLATLAAGRAEALTGNRRNIEPGARGHHSGSVSHKR